MNFSSDNVELFLVVLAQGSFSAAARRLGRVPSAVSMAVANLEAELGYTLFDRGQRELRPTQQALALAPQARRVADQLCQLRTHAAELSRGLESTLALGVAADINSSALVSAMAVLAQRYPLLNIEIRQAPQDEVLAMLHRGDVAVCFGFATPSINAGEQFLCVGMESLVAVISAQHGLPGGGTDCALEDLANVRQIIVASRDHPMADPRPLLASAYWRTDTLAMALHMVEAGLGWGNFPQSLVEPLLQQGRLTRLRFENTRNALNLPVHLIWRNATPLGKAARELVELMGQTAI